MSGYIGVQPVPQTTQTRDSFTATANQTSFGTSGYQVGFLDVYLNGVKLAAADFTATNGSDVVLATGAALNDILEVVAFSTFSTSNGTFTGTTTFDTVVVTNTVDGRDVSVDGAKLDTIPVISTSSTASFIAKGDGSSQDGYIQLNCYQNTHGIKLKSPPHSASASYTLTFPNDDGTANQLLSTDGSGVLSWATVSASDSTKLPLAGGAMTGAITTNSTFDGVDVATRDAVLTSTTTTAGAALPKAGGALTGAVTTNSTFDGVDIATRDAVLTSTTTTANAALPKAGGAMTGVLSVPDGSTSSPSITNTGDLDTGISFPAINSIAISTAGTQRLVIDSAGFFDVTATGNDVARFSGLNSGSLVIRNDTANQVVVHTGTSDSLVFGTGGNNDRLTITSTGDILAKTADARIGSDVGSVEYGTSTNNSVRFYSNNAERMRIDGSGKVGIGITAPLAPLHIRLAGSGSVPVTVAKFETISNAYGRGPQLDFNVFWGSDIPTAKISAPNVVGGGGYGGELRFSTNGPTNANSMAERMRISSSGNVGIGITAPVYKLDVAGTARFTDYLYGGSNGILYTNAHVSLQTTKKLYLDSGSNTYFQEVIGDNVILVTGGYERLRVDASGRAAIGTTPAVGGQLNLKALGDRCVSTMQVNANGDGAICFFNQIGTGVGNVLVNSSSVTYGESSDYRLKENVVYDWDATTRLKQLKPARFNFIADGADTVVDGFLAHEAQAVVPESVTGTKDAMRDEEYEVTPSKGKTITPATNEVEEIVHSTDVERPETLADGQEWQETTAAVMGTRNVPDMQNIDRSKLVPLLVKTIQELEARITALEA